MSAPIKVALPGFGGRMGQMIARLVQTENQFTITAATEAPHSNLIGHDLSESLGIQKTGVEISSSADMLGRNSDVIIDFTRPEATMEHLRIAVETNTSMVIGTTGLNQAQEKQIEDAGKHIPIIYCANTSIGVTLDAPSGTALALGAAAAEGRSVLLGDVRDSGRDGLTGARKQGDIGFSVIRGGDVAGEHSVIFFGKDERIELTHKANDRVIFARGALKAAQFIVGKLGQQGLNGYFTMDDVLG